MAPNAGYTLKQIRQFAASEAGKFVAGTADSTSTTSTLIDLTWPVNSSVAGAGLYKDYYVYTSASAAADQMRRVKTYTGTGGLLAVDTAYGVKPAGGDPYELHGMFPPIGNDKLNWLTFINDGLKNCYIPVEVSFNPANNTDNRQSLATAAPWLSDPMLVRKAGLLSSGQSRSINDPYRVYGMDGWANCEMDGTTIYLNTWPRTFQTTDTIYLWCLKPIYYHCAPAAGSYGSQSGLALETDVAPLDNVEWGAYAALVEAWRRMLQLADISENQRLSASLQAAVAYFNEFSPEYNLRYPLELKRRDPWFSNINQGPDVFSQWNHG